MTAPPTLVAIDGGDGSGKSMLAERLLAALADEGAAARLLRVDDFRRPIDWTRRDRAELDIYYDEYYDLPALDAQLQASLAAGPAAAAITVVEGVFVRRLPVLAAVGATVIDIETSRPEARRRILARDVAKGRTPDEVRHRIDARYFPAQARYRAALAAQDGGLAAIVIDNENPAAPRLVRLDETSTPAVLARAIRRLVGG